MRRHAFACLLLAAAAAPAHAKAIDPAECKTLDAEVTGLETAGIKLDIEKGVEWGKANLSSDRLQRIRHYFEIREKVLFRCPELIAAKAAAQAARPKTTAGDKKASKDAASSGDEEGGNEFEIIVPANNRSQNK